MIHLLGHILVRINDTFIRAHLSTYCYKMIHLLGHILVRINDTFIRAHLSTY